MMRDIICPRCQRQLFSARLTSADDKHDTRIYLELACASCNKRTPLHFVVDLTPEIYHDTHQSEAGVSR